MTGFHIEEFIVGKKAGFYTIVFDGEAMSEADKFFEIINKKAPKKAENLYSNIEYQAEERGCQDHLFTYERDVSVYKMKEGKWRLYCIRFGKVAVILGGGDFKDVPKTQDSEILEGHVEKLRFVNKLINERISNGDLYISDNGLVGNFKFEIE